MATTIVCDSNVITKCGGITFNVANPAISGSGANILIQPASGSIFFDSPAIQWRGYAGGSGACLLQPAASMTSVKIMHLTQTGDTPCANMSLETQAPFATATGANRKPGNLLHALGIPTNSGTTYAKRSATWGTKGRQDDEHGHVQTTDATPNVVIGSITLANDETCTGFAIVQGHEIATGDTTMGVIGFGVSQVGGTVNGIILLSIFAGNDAGAATWSVSLNTSGATIQALATGQAGKTIEWSVIWINGVMAP